MDSSKPNETARQRAAGPKAVKGRGLELIACPICGCAAHEHYVTGPDRVHAVPGTFSLVRCLGCGLVYQNPRPTAKRLQPHYPSEYGPYRRPRRSWLARLGWRHGFELYRRCRFVSRHTRGTRILDIGCASGSFLSGIRDFGNWDVAWGVEMDRRAALLARRRGVDVVVARIEKFALPERYFDAVTMWDVLEHLPEPVARLGDVRRSLRPGGFLFASVPALDSLDARLFGRYWIGLDLPRHLQVPTRDSLGAMMREAGFEIVSSANPTGSHHSFAASTELLLDERLPPSSLRRGLTRLAWSSLFRLCLTPYFVAVESRGLGAGLTVAARPTGH